MRLFAVMSLVCISGCATGQLEVNGVEPYKVKQAVHCQISSALQGASVINPSLAEYAASYVLTLKVERRYSAGLSALDWVIPLRADDHLNLGVGFGVGDRKLDSTVLKGKVAMGSKVEDWCDEQSGGLKIFRGDLGISDWLRSAVAPDGKPGDLGRTIEFGIAYDGNLSPGFEITNLSGNAGVGGSQTITNTLDIALFNGQPPKPQEVVIVNPDGRHTVIKTTPAAPADSGGERVLDYLLMDRTSGEIR